MTAMTMATKRSGSEVTTATRRRRRRHSDSDEAQRWGMAAGYDDVDLRVMVTRSDVR